MSDGRKCGGRRGTTNRKKEKAKSKGVFLLPLQTGVHTTLNVQTFFCACLFYYGSADLIPASIPEEYDFGVS